MTERYLIDPKIVGATLKVFRHADLVRLSFVPDRIRSYAEIH